MKLRLLTIGLFITAMGYLMTAQNNIAEEVAWIVGDEAIFKSDIEEQYLQLQYERTPIEGNPYCVIPEQIAIEKLFLHQAKIDTIEVANSTVQQSVDARINYFIANLGSKEKVEEYFRKPLPEIREQLMNTVRDQYTIQQVQSNLTKDVKATPADVRKFYNSIPKDSLPLIQKQVEVEIITINPVIPQQEIDEVKSRLRDYAQRVNNGESDFATLALLYSEDGSAMTGGEIGFKSRNDLVTEYANVAFNLNDPKKVSKIVETEFGYHIIQLIEKRGDRINTRHILLKPKVSQKDLDSAVAKLDSLRKDIVANKYTFEQAALYVSQDKDSRNNKGLMMNPNTHTTLFEMADLPDNIGKVVDKLNVGEMSEPFITINQSNNRQQVAMVKLVRRIEAHKADLAEDFQVLKTMYENQRKSDIIDEWVKEKQSKTYVHISEGWRDCEFKYDWQKK